MFKFDDDMLEKGAIKLKEIFDGKPQNINPLNEIPEPEMILYVLNGECFETQGDLLDYVSKRGSISESDELYILQYIRSVADKTDVIRKINHNGTSSLITAVDRYGYAMYDYRRSLYRGKFTWIYFHGNIKNMYEPFKDRGIQLENDIYEKIENDDKMIMQMMREKNKVNQ